MALIQPAVLEEYNLGPINGRIIHWDNITENDTCGAYEVVGFADKSIDVNGDFGGGSIAIKGANHPTAPIWTTLTDALGIDLSGVATNQIMLVLQHTKFLKPVRVGGVGMDIDITMVLYNHTR